MLSVGGKPANPPTLGTSPKYSGEIYSPPYLFQGFRPTINTAPGSSTFGATVEVTVVRQENNFIDRVVLLRPASVTHHFDNDQRYIELDFAVVPPDSAEPYWEALSVTLPSVDLAPPGMYMLFVVESNGSVRVPSAGVFLDIQ